MDHLIKNAYKLALYLRPCRKSKGLTQANVAGRSGLLPKTISLLENHPERYTVESSGNIFHPSVWRFFYVRNRN